MKNIILKSLELNHFKGIKHLTINFNHRTDVSGDNATGKTTLFDAFTWLLFDKDSLNRKDFGIKTYDGQGDTLHGVDHSVAGTLEIDGKPIHLKKTYSEIWTKKRGKSEAEFTGHTTEYEINSVPVKKSEYDARIQSIIPEEQFKLLTNPHFFNEVLDKKQRREIILSLENISDEDILETYQTKPAELVEKLKDYTTDEIKAMAKASMKKLNDEINDLPVRIDELTNQIIEHDFKALEIQKKELQAEFNLLSGQIEDVQQIIQAANAKARALTAKKAELDEIERRTDREYQAQLDQAKQAVREAQERKKERDQDIEWTERRIKTVAQDIESLESKIDAARKNWSEINERKAPQGADCKSCGQPLPQEQLEDLVKDFNRRKSNELEQSVKLGKQLKEDLEERQKTLRGHKEDLEKLQQNIIEIPEIEDIPKPELPIEWHQLKAEIEADEQAMQQESELPSQSEMSSKKSELSEAISAIDEQLGQRKRNVDIKARIEELKAQEKSLARSYEQQEKLLKQVEDFIRTKVEMISSKVNSHFEHVEFKLFDVQINGGINETCEATINGVPYSDANNAAKINAGLDIINTLSKVYQTTAPIFVDNAESVNTLIDTDSQLIRLIVSKDKELTVK